MIDSVASATTFDDATRLRAGPAASWSAIFCGAAVAMSTSLLLLALGTGLGFASISPWADRGVSATTFTMAGIIWLIVTQWISALLGGYITGRLRHRWLATHGHEVFFRDTAHGLVTWAVATLAVAALAGSALSSIGGAGVHALGAMGHEGVRMAAEERPGEGAMLPEHGEAHSQAGPKGGGYEMDKLFRTPTTGAAGTGGARGDGRMEAAQIALHAAASGSMPAEDRAYLATLVAANTGVTPQEAQARVDAFIAEASAAQERAKAAADAARKAAADTAILTALAMLIGAFIASVAAAVGGRLRDEHL